MINLSDNWQHFTTHEVFLNEISDSGINQVRLGSSEEGRPLVGFVIGSGKRKVSLMAGAHADEPVGPETLRQLIRKSINPPAELKSLLEEFQFFVQPQINPDGEARNQTWISQWPNMEAYLQYVEREKPGRDIEFGYPDLRKENNAVADWLRELAPFDLHMSLHGMGFSEGVLLLIEKHWIEKTIDLQIAFGKLAQSAGLKLHDHDRKGAKGFVYIGPGFTTTPQGTEMRKFFDSLGDSATASLFKNSSMEFVRSLGGDPLCLVTEFPLFVLNGPAEIESESGIPSQYLDFAGRRNQFRTMLRSGKNIATELENYHLEPIPVKKAIQLQWETILLGLDAVR